MENKYRHYKGGLYEVIGEGMHTETEEKLVFYRGEDGRLWVRPVEMFYSYVEYEGKKLPRFKKLN